MESTVSSFSASLQELLVFALSITSAAGKRSTAASFSASSSSTFYNPPVVRPIALAHVPNTSLLLVGGMSFAICDKFCSHSDNFMPLILEATGLCSLCLRVWIFTSCSSDWLLFREAIDG